MKKKRKNKSSSAPVAEKSALAAWTALPFGVLFGYFLSKGRVTDYNTIQDMFLFREFHMYGLLITAVLVVAAGTFLLRRWGHNQTLNGATIDWRPVAWNPRQLIGALLFGIGWALAGTCPGPAFTQIGEGKFIAFFTVFGVFCGAAFASKIKKE